MVGLGLLRVGLRLSRLWVPLWVSLLRRALLRRALLWILRRVALLRRVAVLLGLVGCSPGGALVPTLLGRRPRIAHDPSLSGHERELSLPARSLLSLPRRSRWRSPSLPRRRTGRIPARATPEARRGPIRARSPVRRSRAPGRYWTRSSAAPSTGRGRSRHARPCPSWRRSPHPVRSRTPAGRGPPRRRRPSRLPPPRRWGTFPRPRGR